MFFVYFYENSDKGQKSSSTEGSKLKFVMAEKSMSSNEEHKKGIQF